MGLDVIASGACVPYRKSRIGEGALTCARPKAEPEGMAIDFAKRASLEALEVAGLTPGQVDLIVSKGVSPSHVADDPDVAGPRVCHPLQRDLKATNAFVFDLMDADWVSALDTVESLLATGAMKTALVVHAEYSAVGLRPDEDSGFTLHDGAGALVLRLNGTDQPSNHADFAPAARGARLKVLSSAQMREGKYRAHAQYRLRTDDFRRLERRLEGLASQRPCWEPIVTERWFPGYSVPAGEVPEEVLTRKEKPDLYLGPLAIPELISSIWQESEVRPKTLTVQTVDPFANRIGQRSISLKVAA